jgi:hypothetical protein
LQLCFVLFLLLSFSILSSTTRYINRHRPQQALRVKEEVKLVTDMATLKWRPIFFNDENMFLRGVYARWLAQGRLVPFPKETNHLLTTPNGWKRRIRRAMTKIRDRLVAKSITVF